MADDQTVDAQTDDTATDQTDDAKEDTGKLKDTLRKEREARRAFEKQAKDLEKRLADIEGKDQSDVERLTRERDALKKAHDDAQTALRDRDAIDALRTELAKNGAVAPDVAVKALRGDLDYDDAGTPTNVEALVKSLRKDAPQLFRATEGGADGGAKGNGTEPDPKTPHEWLRRGHDKAQGARRG